MLTNKYKYLIIISILTLICLYSVVYKPPVVSSNMQLLNIPEQIADWHKVKDLTISDNVYAALKPDSLIMREYMNVKGDSLILCIVYHQNERWGAHDPKVCYRSQGWEIQNSNTRTIKNLGNRVLEVNEFVISNKNENRIVTYWWFTSGKKCMSSRLKHMVYMCRNGFMYGYIESGFIRISTPISLNDFRTSRNRMDNFLRSFVPILESKIN